MPTPSYDQGDVRRLKATFTDSAGAPADPDGVQFTLRTPGGVQTSYVYLTDAQLVKDSTGVYHVDWTVNDTGRHHYRFAGTGASGQVTVGEFWARSGVFA